jgi:hypothetical protein
LSTHSDIFTPSKGVTVCISLSSEGEDILSIVMYSEGDFKQDIKDPLSSLQGFTTSFDDDNSGKLNTQIHFDADPIFFVL